MDKQDGASEVTSEIANGIGDPIEGTGLPVSYFKSGELAVAAVAEERRKQGNHHGLGVALPRFLEDPLDPREVRLVAGDRFQCPLPVVDEEVVAVPGHVHGAEDDVFVRPEGVFDHVVEFGHIGLPGEFDGIGAETPIGGEETSF